MYRHITVCVAGFISLTLQAVLLRELLSASSGNELDIGITLGIWLLCVGAGSLLGERLTRAWAFGASFLVVSALAVPVLWGVPHLMSALGGAGGQALSLGNTFLLTLCVLLPLCLVLGAQFPLAVAFIGGEGGRDSSISLVYGLEALGAFIGGMVSSFVLSGRVGPGLTVLGLSVLSAASGALLLDKKAAFAVVSIPVAAFAGMLLTMPSTMHGGEIIERAQSRYSEIVVTSREGQYNFYSSGNPAFSYPDRETEERGVHLPMAVHPRPFRVLVVGGSPAQLGQYLKYSIDGVDFMEMDPLLLKLSMKYLDNDDSSATVDRRVRMIVEDARAYLKSVGPAMYDLIIVNVSGMDTASSNRMHTEEFFREASHALREGGVLALHVPTSSGYVSRRMRLASGAVFGSLGEVFEHTEVSTEEYGLLLASDKAIDTGPQALVRRFQGRVLDTEYFRQYLLEDAFTPERTEAFRARLEGVGARNSDMRPIAYLYNLMLWAETQDARWLNRLLDLGPHASTAIAMLFLALGAAVFRRERKVPYYAVSVAGFSSMGFMVVIILGFQATYGYVYEMFALLSALFMVGMALGSISARTIPVKGLRAVLVLDVLTAVLASAAIFIISMPAALYAVSLLAGLFTGAQFAFVSQAIKFASGTQPAGRLYAVDLAGSFLGALCFSILVVPVSGLAGALVLIAVLKTLSAVLVGTVRHA